MFTRTSLLCLAFGLGMMACGGGSADDDPTTGSDSAQDELRATSLAGTYEVGTGSAKVFDYETLSLKSDHTFKATANGGKRVLSGSWWSGKAAGGGTQITFRSKSNDVTPYFYSINGASLRLSDTLHGKVSVFVKSTGSFPKVQDGAVCSDNLGNVIAECPTDFACQFDGDPKSKLQRCWPDR